MKNLRILVPALVTAVLTVIAIFLAMWLTGLVPPGEWSELIKAAIIIFIVGGVLLVIAWSAYFTYAIREFLRKE